VETIQKDYDIQTSIIGSMGRPFKRIDSSKEPARKGNWTDPSIWNIVQLPGGSDTLIGKKPQPRGRLQKLFAQVDDRWHD
jgi:hypothetical protein